MALAAIMIVATYLFRWWIMRYYGDWNSTEKIIFTENFTGRADHFAFGILAALGSIHRDKSSWAKKLSPVLMLFGGIGIVVGMQMFAQLGDTFRSLVWAQIFLHSLIAFCTAVFLFGLSSTFNLLKKIIGNPVLEFLGMISYSFYVWHFLIIENVLKLDLGVWKSLAFSFAATLILAVITYVLVERPFLQEKKY